MSVPSPVLLGAHVVPQVSYMCSDTSSDMSIDTSRDISSYTSFIMHLQMYCLLHYVCCS